VIFQLKLRWSFTDLFGVSQN